uniref:Uncharacterized protein n=1 Tax=Fagus sylvatica TaxID=28930 RepID=A0A2N9FE69_FAGSY
MRLLVHSGFFTKTKVPENQEDDEEVYTLTPSSRLIIKDKVTSLSPFVQAMLDPVLLIPALHSTGNNEFWYCSRSRFMHNNSKTTGSNQDILEMKKYDGRPITMSIPGSQFRDLGNHELLSLGLLGVEINTSKKKVRAQEPCLLNSDKEETKGKFQFIQNIPMLNLQSMHKDKIHHNHLQNQSELVEAIKQLKENDASTKTLPQNEGGNQEKPHQDSGSHEKETTFVTMIDVANLLKQEREKNPKEPRLFVKKPPYPTEWLKQPYPEKYVIPTFSRFDGRKGSALVHISKFIDSMGAYAGNGDLCLREFSKSLDDRAYTWYTTLPPGSVKLLQKARKTVLLVKPHTEKSKERKSQPQVLTVSTANNKRKKSNERSFEEPPPPVPCTLEEMMAILNKWVADGIVKLPEISKKVHIDPFLKHKEKGTVSVVIHGSASDADMDEPVAANSAMTSAAIKTLQRNHRFRSLFNQLGLNPEARTAATEAIMAIAADSGAHCFTAETPCQPSFSGNNQCNNIYR